MNMNQIWAWPDIPYQSQSLSVNVAWPGYRPVIFSSFLGSDVFLSSDLT